MPETLPEIIVFAGPNGSGKSTVTKLAKIIEPYINADDIKRASHCADLEAAEQAERMREDCLSRHIGFTFETVLSTNRNLTLLQRAKQRGYFIRCIYVLTCDCRINIARVKSREAQGGHGVPVEKIVSRYKKALALLPELVSVCDVMHIYDNTEEPFRIFKKRKQEHFFWQNKYWSEEAVQNLLKLEEL